MGVMKKCLVLAAVGVFGIAATAQATDLPTKAPPAPPVVRSSDWTGFYVGVLGGGGWGRAEQTDGSPFSSGSYNISGALAGMTWGYNWQIGRLVVGFESDASWSNIRGSTDGLGGFGGGCGGAPPHCEATLQWFGSDRLRLGYAVGRWLPFLSGGLAWGYIHGKEGDTPSNNAAGSGSELHYGWAAGGGIEAMIDPHWSAKAEYLYADLRSGKVFVDQFAVGGPANQAVQMRVQVVRAGVNYKFDAGSALLPGLPPSPITSASAWTWSGLYAGINYGSGAGRASQSDVFFDRGSYDVGGAIAGGTVGYNWQRNTIVYGLEGDLDYSWIKGANSGFTSPPCGAFSSLGDCNTRLRWLGTARARIGLTWDRLLPYVTGGLAVGSLESAEGDLTSPFTGSGSKTRAGWTAGAGIEARIDHRWSAKLEYLYVDLGKGQVFTEPTVGGGTVAESVGFRTHILRSGVNYRFN